MFRLMTLRSAALGLGLLTLSSLPAFADSIFNFESTTSGTSFPLTLTNNGLSATFTGSASVCASGGLFSTLSGNVAIQAFCGSSSQSGPLSIAFSQNLSSLSFDFATAGGPGTLNVQLFENGVGAGSQLFTSSAPLGRFNGEGLASLSGTFNSVTLTGSNLLAADNLDAATVTPEPATIVDCLSGTVVLAGFFRRSRAMARRS